MPNQIELIAMAVEEESRKETLLDFPIDQNNSTTCSSSDFVVKDKFVKEFFNTLGCSIIFQKNTKNKKNKKIKKSSNQESKLCSECSTTPVQTKIRKHRENKIKKKRRKISNRSELLNESEDSLHETTTENEEQMYHKTKKFCPDQEI